MTGKKSDRRYKTDYRFGLIGSQLGLFFTLTLDGKKDFERAVTTAREMLSQYNVGSLNLSDTSIGVGSGFQQVELHIHEKNVNHEHIIDSKTYVDKSTEPPAVH
jgi:hypothetical protein